MASETMLAQNTSEILERAIADVSPEEVLKIRFTKQDIARMDELSAKASQGTLTAEEDAELEIYIHLGNLIDIMHSRARLALKETGPSS